MSLMRFLARVVAAGFVLSALTCHGQISVTPSTIPSGIGSPSGLPCGIGQASASSTSIYDQRDIVVGNAVWKCRLASDGVTYAWVAPFVAPSATVNTSSIGGTSLLSLGCTTGTATIAGAVVGTNTAVASPLGQVGSTAANSGLFNVTAWISAANTVTVAVCNMQLLSATPNSVAYKVLMY